jgi:serine/threonine protein phosphatase 1
VPPGMRVYAFGDVHGRADLLGNLLKWIDNDLSAEPSPQALVVGLGDYVDRGPNSRAVLDLLIERQGLRPGSNVFLKGNHEAMLLEFLRRPSRMGSSWLEFGGWETLQSYGLDCPPHANGARELVRIRDEFAARLPPEHLSFLQDLPVSRAVGGYLFVHAGVRPGVRLDRQSEDDMIWIRHGFSDRDKPFEKVIVHGHSPVAQPFVGRNRINLDTGAYATGKLSCAILEAQQIRLVQVSA